jgi:tetratricopeptide (TPR) repeat protein
MVFCQDAALRQQMCEGAQTFAAGLSLQAHKLYKNASPAMANGSKDKVATFHADAQAGALKTTAEKTDNASVSDMASSVSMVDQAVSVLSAQIAKDPNNPSLHNRLGLIYASVGELQRAENQFNQAVDRSREQLGELNAQLIAKKEKGQIAQASQIMLEANQIELELSSAHSNLARVFEKLGQQTKVVAQLDQLNKDVIIGEGPNNAAVSPIVVVPKVIAAQAVETKTGGSSAASPKKVSAQLVVTLAKAQALMQAGRVSEAVPQLQAVLAIDPGLAETHEQLGLISLSAGNFGQAVDELSKAAEIAPNKASTHAALGVAYQYKGKAQEAITEFTRALALNAKDSSSAFNLGNAYAALGKNNEATRYFQKAVSIDPKMGVAHNNLGSLYSLKGNYELAVKEFESAVALAPQMYSAHYGLGLALYHSQDYGSASREFEAALALNPGLVDAHQKIAECQRLSGQVSKHMYQDVAMR